jgi:hypothetical protein
MELLFFIATDHPTRPPVLTSVQDRAQLNRLADECAMNGYPTLKGIQADTTGTPPPHTFTLHSRYRQGWAPGGPARREPARPRDRFFDGRDW